MKINLTRMSIMKMLTIVLLLTIHNLWIVEGIDIDNDGFVYGDSSENCDDLRDETKIDGGKYRFMMCQAWHAPEEFQVGGSLGLQEFIVTVIVDETQTDDRPPSKTLSLRRWRPTDQGQYYDHLNGMKQLVGIYFMENGGRNSFKDIDRFGPLWLERSDHDTKKAFKELPGFLNYDDNSKIASYRFIMPEADLQREPFNEAAIHDGSAYADRLDRLKARIHIGSHCSHTIGKGLQSSGVTKQCDLVSSNWREAQWIRHNLFSPLGRISGHTFISTAAIDFDKGNLDLKIIFPANPDQNFPTVGDCKPQMRIILTTNARTVRPILVHLSKDIDFNMNEHISADKAKALSYSLSDDAKYRKIHFEFVGRHRDFDEKADLYLEVTSFAIGFTICKCTGTSTPITGNCYSYEMRNLDKNTEVSGIDVGGLW